MARMRSRTARYVRFNRFLIPDILDGTKHDVLEISLNSTTEQVGENRFAKVQESVFCVFLLECLCHKVFTTYEAEDSDFVIFVENSESTENLIEDGAAGGHIVNDEHVLFPNRST